ncbi:MAG TPA: matrixin family metalloprotease, partial [Nitrosopumilaceae archaeon]|nr:matrixin family metalloprotease [Nitrosopumilaceae archaeon]
MKVLAAILLSVIMLSSGFMINSPAIAEPNEKANDRAKYVFKLPANAVEIAPGIYHIGTAIHEGKIVDGIVAYHHKTGHNGGPGNGGPGSNDEPTSTCFAFLANGVKWNTIEDYLVDPSNTVGLNEDGVRSKIATAIQTWEDSTTGNIFGIEVSGNVDGVMNNEPDNKNEVFFGDVDGSNSIAVTIVWGIFRGPPSERELVEWNQVYDQVEFTSWSLTGEPDTMDFLNIATHEVGHAAGLGHPDSSCTEETMFAFASLGETKKQDL